MTHSTILSKLSLEAERSGVLVYREMVERSKVKIVVNERELKLYLASTMEENEVKEEGWEEFVHKKKNKSKNNRKPGITTEEILGERKNEKSKWEEPEKMADEEMIKKMLGKALEIGVKAVMQNNIYRFAGEIRVQEKRRGHWSQNDWRFGKGNYGTMGQTICGEIGEIGD